MGFKEYVSKQFGNPSGVGGAVSTFIMNRINRPQYASVIAAAGALDGKNILDIGFGNGYLLNRLARRYDNRYYGVDISPDMLASASKRNGRFTASSAMTLALGSADSLPFDGKFFDLVYTVNTVYFWPDLEKGLAEIHRVLKPGGAFLNVIYVKEWLEKNPYTRYGFTKYTVQELAASASKIGYAVTAADIKKNVSCKIFMSK